TLMLKFFRSAAPHVIVWGTLDYEPLVRGLMLSQPDELCRRSQSMKKSDALPAAKQSSKRLRELTAELQQLEARLRLGGGPDKIKRQHVQGKLTARERIDLLLDKNS